MNQIAEGIFPVLTKFYVVGFYAKGIRNGRQGSRRRFLAAPVNVCFLDFAIFIYVHIMDNISEINKCIFYPGKNLLTVITFRIRIEDTKKITTLFIRYLFSPDLTVKFLYFYGNDRLHDGQRPHTLPYPAIQRSAAHGKKYHHLESQGAGKREDESFT